MAKVKELKLGVEILDVELEKLRVECDELVREQSKHQRVQDAYVVTKRFRPSLSKGDYEWDEAAEARAKIRNLQKQIDVVVRKARILKSEFKAEYGVECWQVKSNGELRD